MKTGVKQEVKLLLFLAAATTLLVIPKFTDPVNLPKFVILMATSFSLAYFARLISIQELRSFDPKKSLRILFHHPVTLSLLVFLIMVLASTTFSQSPLIGLFGLSGRRNGFFTYLALFVLFLLAAKSNTRFSLHYFMKTLALVGSIESTYMLIQYLNIDPLPWDSAFDNNMFGTLGNPNFSSAFLAMSFPAIIFCVFSKSIPVKQRVFFSVGAVLSLSAITLAGVYQGPLSLAVSATIVFALFIAKSTYTKSVKMLSNLFVSSSIVVLSLGILKIGPLAPVFLKDSFQLRANGYWPVAMDLGLTHPFLGVGHEQFVNYFPGAVGIENRLRFGQMIPDNAHNYLLHFFAEGGFLVALPYFLFLTVFSFSLINLFWRSKSENSLLILGCIGVWTAFIGQMLVSIDNMGISVWVWILAGMVVGANSRPTDLGSSEISNKRRVVASGKAFKDGQRKLKAVKAIGLTLVILLPLTQLSLLDNKVWSIESSQKIGGIGRVTESDLQALQLRSRTSISDPILLSRASSLLLSYGFKEEGFDLLNRTIELNPDSPSVYNLKAAATEAILSRSSAVPIRLRELEIDPWNSASSLELIRDLLEQNNVSAARKELLRLEKFADNSFIDIAKSLFLVRGEG